MAIPWPSSPTVGQSFTYGSITYTWNGVAWINTVTNTPAVVGSVAVTAPIVNTGTPTAPVIGISQSGLTITESQVTNLVSDLAGKATLASANTFTVGGHIISNASAGVVALSVKGAASQTENVQVWQNSGASTLARVSANGSIATAANLAVGLTAITNANQFQVTATSATQTGAVIRGAASQTADFLQIQNSSGTSYLTVNNIGSLLFGTGSGSFLSGSSGRINVQLSDATAIGVSVRGAASQSANLQEWQNSGSTVIASITNGGALATTSYVQNVAANTPYIDFTTANKMIVQTRNAAYVGLTIRGSTSQSVNLEEWQDSAGTVLASISSAGASNFASMVATGTARASAGLGSSSVALSTIVSNVTAGHLVLQNISTAPNAGTGGGTLYADTGALKYRGTSGSAATIVNADGTMAGGSFTGGTLTSNLTLVAGNTSVYPLTFQTNAGTPTASAGTMDYDGDKFYAVTSGTTTGRLMLPLKAWAYSNANATSATTNTAQSIFPIGARTLPLEAGKTYYFRLNLGANFTFSAVPASIQLVPTFSNIPVSIYYNAMFISGTSGGVQSFRATATTAQNISPTLASTTSNSTIVIEGYFQSNATTGGTVEFKYQINTGGGSSATILANSYEEIVKIGTGASAPLVISGSWS